ncbi:MAG: FAD-dependent oxidoreductase [Clostridia bacterium]|nr:FAD-dependent oxidoreductase [Clostridia bacterium]
MKLIYRQIALAPDVPRQYAVDAAVKKAASCGIRASGASICRISVDSRKKNDIKIVYSVLVEAEKADINSIKRSGADIYAEPELKITYGDTERNGKIAVIGFGPAGIFASLMLIEHGYGTVIFERGRSVSERAADINKFLQSGVLDTESNIQFGAGGAGTFSDGKLITRINDNACNYVLQRLAGFGAPEDILYSARPHIGTDILQTVIADITKYLTDKGTDIRFNTKVTSITESSNGVIIKTGTGEELFDAVVLATGHSARDVYKMLYNNGIELQKKPFSVGCRIEHLREDIDVSMYGPDYYKYAEYLPHAEYNLSCRAEENGQSRGVYSFCMCPGGKVICSSSETGGVVTNGMSYHRRDGQNSNSALAVSVLPDDLPSDVLSGIEFQRRIEQKAYSLSHSYNAPCQTVGSFLKGKKNEITTVIPSYEPGIIKADLHTVLPDFVCGYLKTGLYEFEKKIKGFSADHAVLTAPETRTSAPVRILRNAERYCGKLKHLYPCGEGAGYAGGITSAAADGINTAVKIISVFKPDKI